MDMEVRMIIECCGGCSGIRVRRENVFLSHKKMLVKHSQECALKIFRGSRPGWKIPPLYDGRDGMVICYEEECLLSG